MGDKLKLVAKLAQIVREIDHVEKSGENKFQNYKYVTAADVAWMVRKQLSAQNIYLVVDVIEKHNYEVPAKEGVMQAIDVKMQFSFFDGDEPEAAPIVFHSYGTGTDKGDKAVYKSMTGALKYGLRHAFIIPDQSDPEADEATDRATVLKEIDKQKADHEAKVAPRPSHAQQKVSLPPVPPPQPIKSSPQEAEDFVTLDGTLLGIEQKVTTKEKGSKPFYKIFMAVADGPGRSIVDMEVVAWDNFALPEDTTLFKELSLMPSECELSFICKEGTYKGKTQYSVKGVNRIGSKVFGGDTGQL